MDARTLHTTFSDLTTPHVADACLRLAVPVRCAPAGVRPLWAGIHVVGRARPARHVGSVDVFLEALEHASPGDVLVVDNDGRTDEACVGDLVALEVAKSGLAGIVIWGQHRDTPQLRSIAVPVFSLGAFPNGPERLDAQPADALTRASCGAHTVTVDDVVLADDDGVILLPADRAAEIAEVAARIRDTERRQAARMQLGTSLREQTAFGDYLAARDRDGLTFRQHLRALDAAIEE
ncbi:RraA family protein [Cellulomonas rhizosphaerae]|uniref:Putative 4-hydroxy-4-methyl-2-oxoglutarate aldolase n=1 Tax=Cellulomonas rhizosphaerae TaxID=2293719 RepID=A0A413RJM1_9CELL|nr:RraA family protein [Cellulomonas rhizosphaerae]RHA38817.1 RraA family protein [Cellulomonas rhizosphaerae]